MGANERRSEKELLRDRGASTLVCPEVRRTSVPGGALHLASARAFSWATALPGDAGRTRRAALGAGRVRARAGDPSGAAVLLQGWIRYVQSRRGLRPGNHGGRVRAVRRARRSADHPAGVPSGRSVRLRCGTCESAIARSSCASLSANTRRARSQTPRSLPSTRTWSSTHS